MSRLDEELLGERDRCGMISNEPYGGWTQGDPQDVNGAYALDVARFDPFLADTQPQVRDALDLSGPFSSTARHGFPSRLQGEITRRGVVAIPRDGVLHRAYHVEVCYPLPPRRMPLLRHSHAQNRFTVTRQVQYSTTNENSLDLVTFVKGIAVATFKLKNQITKRSA
ncbi:type I restriction endonuclease [Cellulosimicrobium sp. CpK407]|uniref:type I restriction endonuclease n=1 Tax=Cellulosimicrobium sp. CpK407 TaxID=3229847 RepID=UPI003F40F72E